MPEPLNLFVSYARPDRPYADELVRTLRRRGVRIVTDDEALHPVDPGKVAESIKQAQVVVVVLSRNTPGDAWVPHEIASALDRRDGDGAVIPVLLDHGARDNVIWPLVATRVPVGPGVEEVRDACSNALRRRVPATSRWRRAVAGVTLAFILLAMALYARWTIRSRPAGESFGSIAQVLRDQLQYPGEQFVFSVSVVPANMPVRGDAPKSGDTLRVRGSERDAVAVYRVDRLVLQCPKDPVCVKGAAGWSAELKLQGRAVYRTLGFPAQPPVKLLGHLDSDLLTLRAARREPTLLLLQVDP